jgi:hypothetical protein
VTTINDLLKASQAEQSDTAMEEMAKILSAIRRAFEAEGFSVQCAEALTLELLRANIAANFGTDKRVG